MRPPPGQRTRGALSKYSGRSRFHSRKRLSRAPWRTRTSPENQLVLNYLRPRAAIKISWEPAHRASVLASLAGLGHLGLSSVYGGSNQGVKGAPGSEFGAVMFGGPKNAPQLLANAGKDAVNLPAETISTVGTLGGDVAGGISRKAAATSLARLFRLRRTRRRRSTRIPGHVSDGHGRTAWRVEACCGSDQGACTGGLRPRASREYGP